MREQERARIARELHDELGQLLTGIKLDFSTTMRRLRELKTPGDVVDRIQSAIGQIDIGIAMVRRIATDLRPGATGSSRPRRRHRARSAPRRGPDRTADPRDDPTARPRSKRNARRWPSGSSRKR